MKIIISGNHVQIDKKDHKFVKMFSWHIESGHGYVVRRTSDKKKYYLHRLLVDAPIGSIVDHINGNKLDNRTKNLRIVNRSINALNSKTPKDNTSGFKGVCFNKNKGSWRAYITKNQRQFHLGSFPTKEEASAAYQGAIKILLTFKN